MKKSLYASFCSLALLLLAIACVRPEVHVRDVAQTFLNVYYAGDYGAAADFCTPALAEQMLKAGPEALELPDETRQQIIEALSKTSFEIVSVEVDEDAGSALVLYSLSGPGLEKPVPKTLSLQLEGRTARVDGIQ